MEIIFYLFIYFGICKDFFALAKNAALNNRTQERGKEGKVLDGPPCFDIRRFAKKEGKEEGPTINWHSAHDPSPSSFLCDKSISQPKVSPPEHVIYGECRKK